MAKLSNKKQINITPVKREEKTDPKYVENTTFGDVGKVLGKLGGCWKVEFKVKGVMAISITDTVVPITKEKYDETTIEEIYLGIVSVYKSGRPVDDWNLGSKRHVSSDGSPALQEASPILKDKVEKKMIDLGTDKASIRALLNERDINGMKKLCGKLNIETGKYNHLNGGLLKMSLVNVALGKITGYLSNGTWTVEKMKEELK